MFRNSLISILFVSIVIVVGNVTIFAQNAPVSGSVELLKADGSREPVEGALVEVFRTDIKASSPPAKTNSKGQFSFAGLQPGWTFILSVSSPGASPNFLANVRPGQQRILITLAPGDGQRLTEDEVRKEAAAPRTSGGSEAPENSAEMKKAQAEYEAKKAEVEAKNKKAESTNQIVTAALRAGNDAFTAKNYDLAIAKYDEGVAADANFVGSAPILLNNRGAALRSRGIDSYNAGIKESDVSEKVAGLGKARKDFADASEGYLRSWTVLKNATTADITDRNIYESAKGGTLKGAVDVFQIAVRTEQVDPVVLDAAKILIPEYIKIESDSSKKAAGRLALADLYRVAGDFDNAIAEYQAILGDSPDNQDALVGAGLSLVNVGYINEDKAKLQEGANLLQKFASAAPDSNKFKADAVALIDSLKKDQNVTPQKVTTKKKP